MAHKYLNKIGISSDEPCIFNTEHKYAIDCGEKHNYLIKRLKRQRKKHSFDERETWSMDFTLASWIYEHFMMYKKIACVDLTLHKFNIYKWDNEKKEILNEKIEVNQIEAINLVLNNIKFYLTNNDTEKEIEASDRFKYAFYIIAEIMPAMWW